MVNCSEKPSVKSRDDMTEKGEQEQQHDKEVRKPPDNLG